MIESLSTLATVNVYPEFLIFYSSLRKNNINLPLFLLCDEAVAELVNQNIQDENLILFVDPEFKKPNGVRATQGNPLEFLNFYTNKIKVLRKALETYSNNLFLDSDICFLQELPELKFPLEDLDAVFSPHLVKDKMCLKYGYYNAGCILVKSKRFLDWWEHAIFNDSLFYEQECLNRANNFFKIDVFPENFNFGWWNLFHHPEPEQFMVSLELIEDELSYKKSPIIFLHTHFQKKNMMFNSFNTAVLNSLKQSKNQKTIDLLNLINIFIQNPNELLGMQFSF